MALAHNLTRPWGATHPLQKAHPPALELPSAPERRRALTAWVPKGGRCSALAPCPRSLISPPVCIQVQRLIEDPVAEAVRDAACNHSHPRLQPSAPRPAAVMCA